MYGKIFSQMYDGTLATRGPWQALVTFQQLIVLANKHGEIDMTAEAISRYTTIPLEIIETGLAALALPDPNSRSPDDEGRRIVLIDENRTWGWRVVNYGHYRKIRSEEDRREYHKLYARRRREKIRKSTENVNSSQQINPASIESTKAVSSKQKQRSKEKATPSLAATALPEWIKPEVWEGFVDMRKKERHPLTERAIELIIKKLVRLRAAGEDPNAVLDQSTELSYRGVFAVHKPGDRFQRHEAKPSAHALAKIEKRRSNPEDDEATRERVAALAKGLL